MGLKYKLSMGLLRGGVAGPLVVKDYSKSNFFLDPSPKYTGDNVTNKDIFDIGCKTCNPKRLET